MGARGRVPYYDPDAMPRRRLALVLGAFFALCTLGAAPKKPTPPTPPLPKEQSVDTSSGAALLIAPPTGMAFFPASETFLGSDASDQKFAIELCRKDVLGKFCDAKQFAGEGVVRTLGAGGPMGSSELLYPATRKVKLAAFSIDRTEVSVADYRRCVEAGDCLASGIVHGDPKHDRDELPVTLVAWDDAVRYCAFRKARLPTEAEWERAARGLAGRRFPWGNLPNPKLGNHGTLDGGSIIIPKTATNGAGLPSSVAGLILAGIADDDDGFFGLAPIGSFPEGRTPEGIVDLSGNVAEWVNDIWDDGYDEDALDQPTGPANGIFRVIRGGSYLQPLAMTRGASRLQRLPSSRQPDLGFRCAKSAIP